MNVFSRVKTVAAEQAKKVKNMINGVAEATKTEKEAAEAAFMKNTKDNIAPFLKEDTNFMKLNEDTLQNGGRAEKVMADRLKNDHASFIADMQNAKNEDEMKTLFNEREIDYNPESAKANATAVDNYFENRAKGGPGATDYLLGYKVPQAAGAAAIGAGMVHSIFGGKGQKTN